MGIIRAYVLPHPPLAVSSVGRGKEKEIDETLKALDAVALEICDLAPNTIIFVTPHNVVYADYFHISPGKSASGDFSRFGARSEVISTDYDFELVAEIEALATANGFPAGTQGERDSSLDHGFTVPAWFINRRYSNYKSARVSQSGKDAAAHYELGQLINEAVERLGRKAVLVASADLSHKLDASGPYGFAPEGVEFDKAITDILSTGDFLSLLNISESLRDGAGECGYNSLTILAGCFDKQEVSSQLLSYEGSFGVGYAVASVGPLRQDVSRDILDRYQNAVAADSLRLRENEDAYRALARRSLEYMVNNRKELPFDDDISEELIGKRAGVFVSLHKNGQLRGCIGTIAPSTENVACEIMKNAVSAGLYDSRFEPVTRSELPLLVYKVDVLSPPEPISGLDELDVKRYGVIVSSGHKRGLLLPNLDGINSVEEQVSIAKRKAGISESAKVKLERFEVIRYE